MNYRSPLPQVQCHYNVKLNELHRTPAYKCEICESIPMNERLDTVLLVYVADERQYETFKTIIEANKSY
jgi:hypothetical protein